MVLGCLAVITENTAGERQMIRKEDNGKTSE